MKKLAFVLVLFSLLMIGSGIFLLIPSIKDYPRRQILNQLSDEGIFIHFHKDLNRPNSTDGVTKQVKSLTAYNRSLPKSESLKQIGDFSNFKEILISLDWQSELNAGRFLLTQPSLQRLTISKLARNENSESKFDISKFAADCHIKRLAVWMTLTEPEIQFITSLPKLENIEFTLDAQSSDNIDLLAKLNIPVIDCQLLSENNPADNLHLLNQVLASSPPLHWLRWGCYGHPLLFPNNEYPVDQHGLNIRLEETSYAFTDARKQFWNKIKESTIHSLELNMNDLIAKDIIHISQNETFPHVAKLATHGKYETRFLTSFPKLKHLIIDEWPQKSSSHNPVPNIPIQSIESRFPKPINIQFLDQLIQTPAFKVFDCPDSSIFFHQVESLLKKAEMQVISCRYFNNTDRGNSNQSSTTKQLKKLCEEHNWEILTLNSQELQVKK